MLRPYYISLVAFGILSCSVFGQQSSSSSSQSRNNLFYRSSGAVPTTASQTRHAALESAEKDVRSSWLPTTNGMGSYDRKSLSAPSASDNVRLIVQFKSPPVGQFVNIRNSEKRLHLPSVIDAVSADHIQFKTDVANIDNRFRSFASLSRSGPTSGTSIRREYKEAINGFAITTHRWIGEEIQKLPYVDRVSLDYPVRAMDDSSNVAIGAPAFWNSTSMHGEGIDIAIIDCGIDYLHPALGHAPFPNSKVVGGYDFVNNDPDPMDDNGHGTHVAGIAAGNAGPSFRGVAYEARLWAFKVLDAQANGYESNVIAGIEAAMDPDGNPLTPSPIKVINLSLGANPEDPNDPTVAAVNTAVASGIVCAVAAGNLGVCPRNHFG